MIYLYQAGYCYGAEYPISGRVNQNLQWLTDQGDEAMSIWCAGFQRWINR